MKAWMVGAVLLTFACTAALASSPVFTGTWIAKNVGMVQAIVFTVGIAETGPVVRIREVSALREDQELFDVGQSDRPAVRVSGITSHFR